jgi:hypothetical protein
MAVTDALAAFAQVSSRHFSHDDRCFLPEKRYWALWPIASAFCTGQSARGCEGESDVTLFFVEGVIAALVGGNRLRSRLLEEVCRDAGGLESLPAFIALPRAQEGPSSRRRVSQCWWATELGTLDEVTRSITRSQLVMPRVSPQSPSWEHDACAKRELGPVIAKWLASGVLELAWNDRMPTLLQPCRPRARLCFIDSSRTLALPTSSTLIVVSRTPLLRSSATR